MTLAFRTLGTIRQARFNSAVQFESLAPLAVSQVDATTWETIAELVFHGTTRTVRVPIGSRTDWASVPPAFAWLISPNIASAAAVLHDYCYRVLVPTGEMTYQEADGLLLEALGALRVPEPSQLLTWTAVRLNSLTKPGGRINARYDLPLILAILAPGLYLASPAIAVLPSIGALILLNRWATWYAYRRLAAHQGRVAPPAPPGRRSSLSTRAQRSV